MRPAERIAILGVYGALLGSALALGADGGWPLAGTHLVVIVAAGAWGLGALRARRLEWRRTPLDLPLALLVGFLLVQIILGNRRLASWALGAPAAPDPERFPAPLLALGSVSPGQTVRALALFLVYAAVFLLVVRLCDRRDRLVPLVRTLVTFGGLLAFAALVDYMTGVWLLWWRAWPLGGRLAGTFENPDHFAAWLTMLALLGLGWVAGRQLEGGGTPSLRLFFASSSARERLLRRYAPLSAVAVMVVAMVFTLSRGALASLLLAFLVFIAILGARGRQRWASVAVLALLAVVAGHAAWIGLEPLLARLPATPGDFTRRWVQWQSSLPMLADFPLLGVGLGAYRDVYFRYQPLTLQPGTVYYPFAHNDLLQLVIELGPLGALLAGFLAWRAARHVIRVRAQRRPGALAIGIGAGATSAVVALVAHSAVDFAARIPATGVLGAACLGIAFAALGEPSSSGRSDVRVVDWRAGRARTLRPIIAAGFAALLALAATSVIRDAVVADLARAPAGPARAAALDRAVALHGGHARVRAARAGMHLDAAAELWRWGVFADGTPISSLDEQRRAAGALLGRAIVDLRHALARTPTDPFLHERLGWAHGLLSLVDPERRAAERATALAHLERAILLAPDNPFLYRSRAVLGLTAPDALLPDALRAAREAVRREPRLLPELVERFRVIGLTVDQWRALAGPSALGQLELAAILEARRLHAEARQLYAAALETAAGHERPLLRWRLASLLVAQGEAGEALRQLDALGDEAADNPEVHLVRARALTLRAAPEALEAYRRAVAVATTRAERGETGRVFVAEAEASDRLTALGLELSPRLDPVRYRRALAQYLLDRREWEAALHEWSAVAAAAPRDADAHYARGIALERLARPAPALEAFQQAVAVDGRQARFRLALGERLWRLDRYHEAAAEWARARELEPTDAGIRLLLARTYLRLGQRGAAVREFEAATRFAPNHPDVRRGLTALDPLSTAGP